MLIGSIYSFLYERIEDNGQRQMIDEIKVKGLTGIEMKLFPPEMSSVSQCFKETIFWMLIFCFVFVTYIEFKYLKYLNLPLAFL